MMLQPSLKTLDTAKNFMPERRTIDFNNGVQQADISAADRNELMFFSKFNERKKEALELR